MIRWNELVIKFISICAGLFVFIRTIICLEISLDGGWVVQNAKQSILIRDEQLPSGVYSALNNANITDSVLNSYNDVNQRWIAKDKWSYLLEFDAPKDFEKYPSNVLVFYGIDTIATIWLNSKQLLPSPHNMFVRYQYNVKDMLLQSGNQLKLVFESPIEAALRYASSNSNTPPKCPPQRYNGECHVNFLRKMQASFSWDWGLAAPSVGIWKPVILEVSGAAILRDVTYNIEAYEHLWRINVIIYLEAGTSLNGLWSFEGDLTVEIKEIFAIPSIFHIRVTNSSTNDYQHVISFDLAKDEVELWWPNGYGDQMLYTMHVKWQEENKDIFTNEIKQIPFEHLASTKSVTIGFRTIELIEQTTDHGNTFYFKVNSIPIFMKGTNWIPIDILPEKMFNREKIDHLLLSVKEAHMNVIRVWGGGVYESDYFYQLADKYGILIWQDMMFACAMYPVFPEFLNSVALEISQNIRRIQSHPSILLWAGNNENEAALVQNWYGTKSENERFIREYIQLYDNVVKKQVLNNDKLHMWLYSSPSNGDKSSNIINVNPQDDAYGDIHFYNYLSDAWDSNIYPKPRFVSEYGFQSIPSMHSIKSTMNPTDQLNEIIEHRQHFPLGSVPIINLIKRHLPLPEENSTNYWKAFIYFSQLSQAIATKTETETYRVGRYADWMTMGALYWQLNDVWVAPSWSSIEYNGNYKVLHHWAREFFAPLHIVANIDLLNRVNLYVIRDSIGPIEQLQVELILFNWKNLTAVCKRHWNAQISENTVHLIDQSHIDTYLTKSITKQNSFIQVKLNSSNGTNIATNFLLLDKIKNSENIINPNLKFNITQNVCDPTTFDHRINIEITVTAPAIFVYVQIKHHQIESYELSKNGFIQLNPVDNTTILFQNRNCAMAISNDNVNILTVNQFIITT